MPQPREPFTEAVMEKQRDGALLGELNEHLANMLVAVFETGKPGSMTIKLKFARTGKGTVSVADSVDVNIPEHDKPITTFFVTQDWNMRRDDPSQPNLPLQNVDRDTAPPLRVVD